MPVYTGSAQILSVGGQDLLGVFKDATLTLETDLQQARYAMLEWDDEVARISRWMLDINTVVGTSEGIALASLLAGAQVAVIFEDSATGGIHLEGNALMTSFVRALPDSDGLSNAIRLKGKGEPTITAST